MNGISALLKDGSLASPTKQGLGEEMVICESGSRLSSDTKFASKLDLALDFLDLRLPASRTVNFCYL